MVLIAATDLAECGRTATQKFAAPRSLNFLVVNVFPASSFIAIDRLNGIAKQRDNEQK